MSALSVPTKFRALKAITTTARQSVESKHKKRQGSQKQNTTCHPVTCQARYGAANAGEGKSLRGSSGRVFREYPLCTISSVSHITTNFTAGCMCSTDHRAIFYVNLPEPSSPKRNTGGAWTSFHVLRMIDRVVPYLESQCGGALGKLDVLRVVRSVPTTKVRTAKCRRLSR